MTKISLENGKYVVKNDNEIITVLRHGQVWRDETGDSLILALVQRIEELDLAVTDAENIACAASDLARKKHNTAYTSEKYIQDCGDYFEIERYDNAWDYSAGTSHFTISKEDARDYYLRNKEDYQ